MVSTDHSICPHSPLSMQQSKWHTPQNLGNMGTIQSLTFTTSAVQSQVHALVHRLMLYNQSSLRNVLSVSALDKQSVPLQKSKWA